MKHEEWLSAEEHYCPSCDDGRSGATYVNADSLREYLAKLDAEREALKADNERLREALVEIAETENYVSHENLWEERPSLPAREMWDIAKQALEGGEHEVD